MTSTGTSVISSNNDLKRDTIQNIIEAMSEKASNYVTEVHQQTNEKVQNYQNSLQNNSYSYSLTEKDIMYAQALGENPEKYLSISQ